MTQRRRAGRTRRESREETQRRLLEAGCELLRDVPVGNVFSHVKAAEVARRAGLSTGAFYHYWPDQQTFLDALLDFHLRRQRTETIEAISTVLTDLVARGEPLEEVVRVAGLKDFQLAKDNRLLAVELGLWTQQHLDGYIDERVRAGYRDRDSQLLPLYRALLDAYKRTVRPPFTVELLAAVVSAAAEGLFIRWSIDTAAVPDVLPPPTATGYEPGETDEDRHWNLFGALLLVLVTGLTAPRNDRGQPGDEPTDIRLSSL